jgi:hypothetical protein
MARSTAAQLRTLATSRKPDRLIDRLLDEARVAAMAGENEYGISPLHDFNALTAEEKAEVKAALETLGFTVETRDMLDRPGKTYTVFRW